MLGILVTGFTAEKVDVSAKTNKELQVNIKDSKYPFSVDEEVKIIVDNKLYSGVVLEVMTIMVFISIKSEEEVPDIVGKTVSYRDKTGVVIGINDFTIISDKEAPEIPDSEDFEAGTDYLILQLNADRCYAKRGDVSVL